MRCGLLIARRVIHTNEARLTTIEQDGVKGIYHLTCVDAVSQWQVEACVPGISEAFLLPVLALIIDQFPFVIVGFHSDHGSEYLNHHVAELLEKLRIEQTKPQLPRARPQWPDAEGARRPRALEALRGDPGCNSGGQACARRQGEAW
ncbi:MAG: hypothetical protein CAPSK01_004748 [Candidatus Accumulibacter vicinus]|uniref:Integrase catalytic domain-containing protein n=1 Tax=Candidatus Accumulibacter vicinus TaxID=2954382 RepID=A0A084XTW5_9PROT|nr:MAG: hypothetical protein CAPSK01_004748 [Candidatus Accumulibacter vicinus]